MIITKYIEKTWNYRNRKKYSDMGYIFTKYGNKIHFKVEDLSKGSNYEIECICDNENCDYKRIEKKSYKRYNISSKDGIYLCKNCNHIKASLLLNKNKLENGEKSFCDWCIENNRQDILDRWDYDLNNFSAKERLYSSMDYFYLKCQNLKHQSDKYMINSVTSSRKATTGMTDCKACNSIAEYGIENICSDFLEKYWDYDLNKISPWRMQRASEKPMYIKCQICGETYKTMCGQFVTQSQRHHKCASSSKGELRISDFLKKNNISFVPQKKFDDLFGLKNGKISYDFFIEDMNTLIEFQGGQHREFTPLFHIDINGFEKQLKHDLIKKNYCLLNNINLIEIWYYDFNNIEEILTEKLLKVK